MGCTSSTDQIDLASYEYNSKHRQNILLFRQLDLKQLEYVLATDLDGTFLGENDNIDNVNKIFLDEYCDKCILVYITGKSPEQFNLALKKYDNLLVPDILITQDGSTIHWFNNNLLQLSKNYQKEQNTTIETNGCITAFQDIQWLKSLSFRWNQDLMEKINKEWKSNNVNKIKENKLEIEKYRVYLYVKNDEAAQEFLTFAKKIIKEKSNSSNEIFEVNSSVTEYNNGFFATMTPLNSGKGNAIRYIGEQLNIDMDKFIIAGDSGNDISMLTVQNIKGIIVNNAKKDLQEFYQNNKNDLNLYLTRKDLTLGVLEGLKYHTKISVC